MKIDGNAANQARKLIFTGGDEKRLGIFGVADKDGGILRFDEIARGKGRRAGIEKDPAIAPGIFCRQRKAKRSRARAIADDLRENG